MIAGDDPRPTRRSILVVDDSPMLLELEATFLSRVGSITTARSGEEALEIARRERPDVVVSDLTMPGLPGDELCRQIKADPDLARTPVILLTSQSVATDHERAIRAGADDVVCRPVNRLLLIQAVNRFLKLAVRGLVRVELHTDVKLDASGHEAWGQTCNVSRGGMYIEAEATVEPQTEVGLEFSLASGAPLSPTAKVVWRRGGESPAPAGMGLQFLKLDRASARLINDYVYERAEGNYDAGLPARMTPVR